MIEANQGFIAVHVGAGQHAESLQPMYRKLCREACREGIARLEKIGGNPVEAVVGATALLENSPLTNAGYGSNLTLNGDVECDASVMDGSNYLFGALGAVSGIKNPIILAKCLCQQQLRKSAHGRIPPSFLVGSGAHVWANEMGIQTVPAAELISGKARKVYAHYKRKLDIQHKGIHELVKQRMDTVGAVCVDGLGNVAAACSSGGIILKYPGRVGQAGVWGCGAWARNGNYSVATSTSGCGEHLIRTTLARSLAEAVVDSSCPTISIHRTMEKDFVDSEFLGGVKHKLGGAIIIRYSNHERCGDLLWTHTTNSMIVGYMNAKTKVVKLLVVRRIECTGTADISVNEVIDQCSQIVNNINERLGQKFCPIKVIGISPHRDQVKKLKENMNDMYKMTEDYLRAKFHHLDDMQWARKLQSEESVSNFENTTSNDEVA